MAEGIRKRGNKYSFRINVKDELTGEWKNIERGGFSTQAEARQARAALLTEYAENPTKALKEQKKLTLDQVYDDFMFKQVTRDREWSTVRGYDSVYRAQLQPRWGKRYMNNITAAELTDYFFSLTAHYSQHYIKNIYTFAFALWKYAEERHYIKENAMRNTSRPREDSDYDKIKVYTQEELDMFEERFSSTSLLPAFKIGRATGVRCGECFGLLWSDISWENHTMTIDKQLVMENKIWTLRNVKTKKANRVIDLQDNIYEYLKELRAEQLETKERLGIAYRTNRVAVDMGRNKEKIVREDLEFINIRETGELLTPNSVKVLGRIANEELGVPFKYHNLRHTHATWLAEHGVPTAAVRLRLGHSRETTTLRYYTHVTDPMRESMVSKLNSFDY